MIETGRRNAGMKEWTLFYSHTLKPASLWMPEDFSSELFIDMARDIQSGL